MQQADLDKLLEEQQDPDSPNYHKWLTPEDYATRFGMNEADLAKVSAWLKSLGLTVNGFSRARTRVFFSGTAAKVENAFRTELHQYQVNGETRFANATEVSVPMALSGMVLGVRGLDNFRPTPRARVAKPNFTSHVSGNHFLSPGDFATIYNVKPLYVAGLDGTGQKIAVVGQTEIEVADIDAFRSAAGLPATNLQLVSVDGSTGFSSGDEVEADLGVEWSGGVAKNAAILYVFTGSNSTENVFDSLAFAIDSNLAPVISISYGNCEANLGAFTSTLRVDAQQANSQGQTIAAAAGDSGSADCESATATTATHGLAVDSPASIPEVTALGGSEFTGDAPNSTTSNLTDAPANLPFWSGTSGGADTISSALIYIPETTWNDTSAGSGFSATGGGVSAKFSKPAWQNALTPADTKRDVPDVTLSASPAHDSTLICSQGSCVNGFQAADGSLNVVGGTSVGAPAFAGILAILNQATPAGGLGNINPTLYTLAVSTPTAFHDITTGNNIVPCTSGSTGCPGTAPFQIGFSAGTGYDLVTGLGSINANALVNAWPTFSSNPNFSVGGTPINVSTPGQSGTSTITVSSTNGFTGTVALTCGGLPAGANCAFNPNSLTSGTSTLTITTTTATPVATSNITVIGASGSISNTVSINLTVSDFTIGVSALSPTIVSAGESATSTITIVPSNGFASTVNMRCSSIVPAVTPPPTCSFVPNLVAAGSRTSILTVNSSTTTPAGLFNVTITGTSGPISRNAAVSLTVIALPPPDFTIEASALSPATISAGGSATSTISIAPSNGFNGNVTFSCSTIAPSRTPRPACSFNPGSVVGGSGTATLTVSTAAPHVLSRTSASLQRTRGFGWVAASGALVVSVLLIGVPSRRSRRMAGLGLTLFVILATGTSCGGGSSATSSVGSGITDGTPADIYTITVTATSASPLLSRTADLAVTVLSNPVSSQGISGAYEFVAASNKTSGSVTVIEANLSALGLQSSASGSSQVQTATHLNGVWFVNVFTGQGTVNGTAVSGAYAGTNSNCSDSGTLTGTQMPNLGGTFSGTLNFPSGADHVTATLSEGSNHSLTVQTTITGADNGNFTFSGSAVANVMFVSGSINGNSFSLFGYFDRSGIYNGTPNSIAVFDDNLVNGVYARYGLLVQQ